jgi:hypothetical protein
MRNAEMEIDRPNTKSKALLPGLSVTWYRVARISLPRTRISTPRGGRKSEPCTIPPRTKKFPRRLVILKRIEKCAAAGIANHGVFRGTEAVIRFWFSQIGDTLEPAVSLR